MSRRNNYIFTNRKHSQKAIMSTVLGVISLVSLIAVIYLTYIRKGDAPLNYGLTGLFIMIFSIIGLLLGIMTAREKDRFKLFPAMGLLLNAVALIGIGLIVYAGMYMNI